MSTPSKKILHMANDQLAADYKACVGQFCLDVKNTDPYKLFCLGVLMSIMTLRDIAEKPDCRFDNADLETCAEAYFEAARVQIHAD